MTTTGRPSYLAQRRDCRYCRRVIILAFCRDGRWRTFDPDLVPAMPAGTWAWRKRYGMEETELVDGHRLHFCAEYADAHGPSALGQLIHGLTDPTDPEHQGDHR
jgi:hypothetical protein